METAFTQFDGTKKEATNFIVAANTTRRHLTKAHHAADPLRTNTVCAKELDDEPQFTVREIARLTDAKLSTARQQARLRREQPDLAN